MTGHMPKAPKRLSGNGRFILPLQAFLDLDPQVRLSAKERLGVLLQPGDQLEKIADLLDQLSLVALAFPAFSDGRSLLEGRTAAQPPSISKAPCAPPARC